jgi:hypothetical protein
MRLYKSSRELKLPFETKHLKVDKGEQRGYYKWATSLDLVGLIIGLKLLSPFQRN